MRFWVAEYKECWKLTVKLSTLGNKSEGRTMWKKKKNWSKVFSLSVSLTEDFSRTRRLTLLVRSFRQRRRTSCSRATNENLTREENGAAAVAAALETPISTCAGCLALSSSKLALSLLLFPQYDSCRGYWGTLEIGNAAAALVMADSRQQTVDYKLCTAADDVDLLSECLR